MSEPIYLTTIGIFFGTVLAIFAMRSFAAIQQAKARLASDEAYRTVAEKAALAETQTAAALVAIQATLDDMRSRLGAIEKVLKEVE